MIRSRPFQPVNFAAAIVFLLMAAGLYWTRSSHGAAARAMVGFGLNIDHQGRALLLSWDPQSPAIAHAGQGILSIRDGGNETKLVLNSRQLSHGSALYVPGSDDVEFRLQVRKGAKEIADSIRIMGGLKPVPASTNQTTSATASNPVPAPAESSDKIDTLQHTKPLQVEEGHPMTSQTVQAHRRKGTADGSQAVVATVAKPARREGAPPVVHLPPVETPQVGVAAQSPPPVEPPAQPLRHAIPTISVNYEAAPESFLRQKIQKVPVLRLMQRNQYRGGDNFLAARATHAVTPQVRTSVTRALPGEWRVALQVSIDQSGQVSEVGSLSRETDERLVNAAVFAIRESRFEPAQLNGRDVSSRLLVTYYFHNPPQSETIARSAP